MEKGINTTNQIIIIRDIMSAIEIEEFFTDEDDQAKYVDRVHAIIGELKRIYKTEFNLILQGELVKQLARAEIQVFHYERMVANDEESKTIVQLLSGERTHIRSLTSQLMATIKEIRSDRSTVKMEVPTDFLQYLTIQLGKGIEDDGEGKDSRDPEGPSDT